MVNISKITFPSLAILAFLLPSAVLAVSPFPSPRITPTGVIKQLGTRLEARLENLPRFLNGSTITAVTPNSLTILHESKSYTVSVDAKTQLRRRFWGPSDLAEMQIGDKVNVIGKWTDDSQTMLLATLIRDLSLRRRNGVFIGTLQSVTPTALVIKTPNHGNNTVSLTTAVKAVNRKGQTIKTSDIAVGHIIRVRGLWDSQSHVITDVTAVKDYTLPAQPKNPTPSI